MSGVSDAAEWIDNNFFSVGGKEVKAQQQEIYDTSEKIINAQANAMERTGAYSEAELNQWTSEMMSENDKNREEALKEADKLITSNRIWNTVGLIGSVASFTGSNAGVLGKLDDVAKGAQATGGLIKASSYLDDGVRVMSTLDDAARALDGVDDAADALKAINSAKTALSEGKTAAEALKGLDEYSDVLKTVKGMDKILDGVSATDNLAALGKDVKQITTAQGMAAKIASKPGQAINTVSEGVGKIVNGMSNGKVIELAGGTKIFMGAGSTAQMATHAGLCLLPVAATQFYTRTRTKEISRELTDTLNVLNDRLAYIDTNMEKFPKEFQEVANTFGEEYSTSMTDCYNAYVSGAITDAEYDQKMQEIADTYTDKYDQLKQDFPDYISDDCAVNSFQYCADRGIDFNTCAEHSQILQDDIDRNPNIARAAEIMQQNKYGTAKTEIGCFFKTINATIIKYCPFVATIEAAALKMSDSAFDFIRDTITQHDGVSKYQNQTIADIADSIKQDSAEHLAAKVAAKDALQTVVDSQQTLAQVEGIPETTQETTQKTEQAAEQTQTSAQPVFE